MNGLANLIRPDLRDLAPYSSARDEAQGFTPAIGIDVLVRLLCGTAIHVTVQGNNTHHMIEAAFKATGRALRQAMRREGQSLPSTKGVL